MVWADPERQTRWQSSRREWTQAKFERYITDGRGQGSGENYKPWITVSENPSMGRSA
jgi:hypothetical protein